MIELVVVVSTMSLVMAAAAAVSVPIIARENMRSTVYDIQTFLQLAKLESVSRNRPCRFVVNTKRHRLFVLDGQGTSTMNDDRVLYEKKLPSSVVFARPDGNGQAIDIDKINGFTYQTVFTSDGFVSDGAGSLYLHDGESYQALSVYVAGGLQAADWNGHEWILQGTRQALDNLSVDAASLSP